MKLNDIKKQGIALVMVLLVLLALMFLGIPFVASMLLKEKTNKSNLFLAKSRIAAISARDYAIAVLAQGCLNEEISPTAVAPYNTPDYDTLAEFSSKVMTYTNVSDPKGVIWSALVADEQSKMNIADIPNVGNITTTYGAYHHTFMDNLFLFLKSGDKLEDYITEHSYRATPWVCAQVALGYETCMDEPTLPRQSLFLRNTYSSSWRNSSRFKETGVRVRLTNGNKEFIATITNQSCSQGGECAKNNYCAPAPLVYIPHNDAHHGIIPHTVLPRVWYGPSNIATDGFYLDRTVPPEFLTPDTILEIEQPHAVNINTASEELVTALLYEVGSRYYDGAVDRVIDERLTLAQAKTLAAMIKSMNFANPTQWLNFLVSAWSSRIISTTQVSTLWTNSRYPRTYAFYDKMDERFTGTLPFCYRSYDICNIKSTGVINYPSGLEAARTTFDDIIEVAPAQSATFLLESQYDFDEQFNMLMGNPRRFSTFPNVSTLRMENYVVGQTVYVEPSYSRSTQPEVGELKLKAAPDKRGNNIVLSDSFNNYQEGIKLTGTALSYLSNRAFTLPPDPTIKPDLYPGGIELWVKFSLTPSGYIADIRQNEYENRVSISYENNELILTVCDAGIERKSARVVAPVQLGPNIWYHIGAYFQGTKYGDLALFLDGKPVGTFGHYDDMQRAIGTNLAADLPDTVTINPGQDLIIPVNDTSNFPPSGVIQVGQEAIEYSEITGGGFKVWTFWNISSTPPALVANGRGQRGTVVSAHPAGARVTLFGYSNVFESQISIGGYPAITVNPLPKGGATLLENINDTLPQTNINAPLGISAADTVITASSVTEFPNEGYLRLS
ncbi:MAG: hypothetical protein V1701_11415, partial [Planctomycetota bacterium]